MLTSGTPSAGIVSKLPSARGPSAAGPLVGQPPSKPFHSSRLVMCFAPSPDSQGSAIWRA